MDEELIEKVVEAFEEVQNRSLTQRLIKVVIVGVTGVVASELAGRGFDKAWKAWHQRSAS